MIDSKGAINNDLYSMTTAEVTTTTTKKENTKQQQQNPFVGEMLTSSPPLLLSSLLSFRRHFIWIQIYHAWITTTFTLVYIYTLTKATTTRIITVVFE